ncbi:MAG TPA: hypothetical protein VFA89_03150 [Terriglobales bacterium]|nr:hypothetical protein [Terriglobales bacterium]
MRKPHLWVAVLCLVITAITVAVAQTATPDMVCEVHVNEVKPGMIAQYEQGRAKHMAWHKSQNDTWSWNTWEITTGEHSGDYLISTCGHPWKDFDGRDKFNAADAANANTTMGAYLQHDVVTYYVLRPELSDPVKPELPPYLSVIFFHLKPEGVSDFRDGVKQVNEAFQKTNTPRMPGYWYTLANGGSGPEMVLVQERKTMADMGGASPKTLDEMMKEAYADQGAATMTSLRKAYYRSESELLHHRPDLSYVVPASK